MKVLSKDMIEQWIIPHLSKGERGPEPEVELCDIAQAILYRLKTGCGWRMIPLNEFFERDALTWIVLPSSGMGQRRLLE